MSCGIFTLNDSYNLINRGKIRKMNESGGMETIKNL